MHYQFRWWYAAGMAFVILCAGYVWDLHPCLGRLRELRAREKQMTEKRTYLREFQPRRSLHKDLSEIRLTSELNQIHAYLMLVRKHGLQLQKIRMNTLHQAGKVERLHTHVSVLGGFRALYSFLAEINGLDFLAVIEDFTSQPGRDGRLMLVLDILSLGTVISHASRLIPPLYAENARDPFCSASENNVLETSYLRAGAAVPLNQIRMTGYVRRGRWGQAIVAMPGDKVSVIETGVILGKERGIVTEISRDHVILKLTDGRRYILKMF
ncbi:hypothetical protein AQUSIP_19830 [Aquicella siphonis]|uniref:Pilus assembly protein PilP n=1 Tax=Aquicella siphonis TaxID=254247 RepID=A0A5E4PI18_9COXI|nr:pilus assembly protein PilP [Aquicella siphonis]VVC76659.1 hypothetical protein AQUSIP_19830 [Aquicella siphonis]